MYFGAQNICFLGKLNCCCDVMLSQMDKVSHYKNTQCEISCSIELDNLFFLQTKLTQWKAIFKKANLH